MPLAHCQTALAHPLQNGFPTQPGRRPTLPNIGGVGTPAEFTERLQAAADGLTVRRRQGYCAALSAFSFAQAQGLGTHRVEMDITAEFYRPSRRIDDDGLEAALKKVSRSLMAPIKPHSVADAQPLHAAREIGFGRFDHQMEVIWHQHVSMQTPAEAFDRLRQKFAKVLVITSIFENCLALVAARGEMMPSPSPFDTQWSRHNCQRSYWSGDRLFNV